MRESEGEQMEIVDETQRKREREREREREGAKERLYIQYTKHALPQSTAYVGGEQRLK